MRCQGSCSPIWLARHRTVPGEHIIHRSGGQLKVFGDENPVPPLRPAAELPHGTLAFCHAVRGVREAAVGACLGGIRLGSQGQRFLRGLPRAMREPCGRTAESAARMLTPGFQLHKQSRQLAADAKGRH